ncbi:MAG: phenylalanine--tRNA ligase subunit beta [Candidatus Micrarchaeota archaeon]|nr:phenylalanine--tRNA ligase subunit beta [Candidatus Micrarchaeota archaeon]
MPVIEVKRSRLPDIPDEELEEILHMIKAPVEEKGEVWKLEITNDRPDLLFSSGVKRDVLGFIGKETGIPNYKPTPSGIKVVSRCPSRPFLGCFVVKSADFDVQELMDFQEKLNVSLGRNRVKAAIGIHDFKKIKPPLEYLSGKPGEKMRPLGMDSELTLKDILVKHPKGREYAHLADGFPVIKDFHGIISFPPIINSWRTRVTEETRDLFIEVTGTDEKTVTHVVSILACNLAEAGGKVFSIEVGQKVFPELEPKQVELDPSYVEKVLGLGMGVDEICEILERRRFSVMRIGDSLRVLVPSFRTDILHQVDLVEEIAIGYGYNNIRPRIPSVPCAGKLLSNGWDAAREIMIGLGFQEVMTFILADPREQFEKMRINGSAVELKNPTTERMSICRVWLLPGLMRILSKNMHAEYPQKIFEVGDCILPDENSENGSKTVRRICGAVSHDRVNLTEIKSIVEALFKNLKIEYRVRPASHPSFIEGRCAEVVVSGKPCGFFGEVHPEVLVSWGMEKPVGAFEFELFSSEKNIEK